MHQIRIRAHTVFIQCAVDILEVAKHIGLQLAVGCNGAQGHITQYADFTQLPVQGCRMAFNFIVRARREIRSSCVNTTLTICSDILIHRNGFLQRGNPAGGNAWVATGNARPELRALQNTLHGGNTVDVACGVQRSETGYLLQTTELIQVALVVAVIHGQRIGGFPHQ